MLRLHLAPAHPARSVMAKKSRTKLPTDPKGILAFWLKAAKEGLGEGKRFDPAAVNQFSPKLRRRIGERLKGGPFTAVHAKNTRHLAKLLGRICRISTDEKTVTADTFQKAFA